MNSIPFQACHSHSHVGSVIHCSMRACLEHTSLSTSALSSTSVWGWSLYTHGGEQCKGHMGGSLCIYLAQLFTMVTGGKRRAVDNWASCRQTYSHRNHDNSPTPPPPSTLTFPCRRNKANSRYFCSPGGCSTSTADRGQLCGPTTESYIAVSTTCIPTHRTCTSHGTVQYH